MSSEEWMFLYDDTENTRTRFVSFMGETNRFDLAITTTERFYGKLLILNLQSNRFAIIGEDDLEEPGYLEHVYQLSGEEAEELKQFIYSLL
ncbi:DUF3055 domain-containing protein [Paenactinomyces guangxiensis]|uniref:DUF3055 domain-containing protein n=1 Tax=Paenactinomyces guangxiensis TaxID=1490290 RepID=A0A7W1WPW1_9BACL|nr:DUF3055 domain-containing protein [Paenactinomyces guangxiensis]MBA4493706.1 DUF3055 domain-containing protein [Paenactinomyces guangxiensis]MBH8590993.1 DUF3055 domain-containing protein [Paenactinomyces guangxiensis]